MSSSLGLGTENLRLYKLMFCSHTQPYVLYDLKYNFITFKTHAPTTYYLLLNVIILGEFWGWIYVDGHSISCGYDHKAEVLEGDFIDHTLNDAF